MSKKAWQQPKPAPGAICVSIGGIGPFYTDTDTGQHSHTYAHISIMTDRARDTTREVGNDTDKDTSTDLDSDIESHRRDNKVKRNVTFSNDTFDQPSFLSDVGTSQLGNISEERSTSFLSDEESDLNSSMLGHAVQIRKRPGTSIKKSILTIPSRKQIYKRRWTIIAISALFVSCVLCNIALVTKSWGHLKVIAFDKEKMMCRRDCQERVWRFGLWQSCRDDGICLGTRWPPLYGLVRCTAVLALFMQTMTLAWSLGHNIEKLLVFDPCTMFALASLCFVSGLFSVGAVCCFAEVWPGHFHDRFNIKIATFGYSFYLQLVSIPFCMIAGICTIMDFIYTWKDLKARVPKGRVSIIKRYPRNYDV